MEIQRVFSKQARKNSNAFINKLKTQESDPRPFPVCYSPIHWPSESDRSLILNIRYVRPATKTKSNQLKQSSFEMSVSPWPQDRTGPWLTSSIQSVTMLVTAVIYFSNQLFPLNWMKLPWMFSNVPQIITLIWKKALQHSIVLSKTHTHNLIKLNFMNEGFFWLIQCTLCCLLGCVHLVRQGAVYYI